MAVEEMGGVVLRLPASWPRPLDVIEALEQVRPRSSRAKTRRSLAATGLRASARPPHLSFSPFFLECASQVSRTRLSPDRPPALHPPGRRRLRVRHGPHARRVLPQRQGEDGEVRGRRGARARQPRRPRQGGIHEANRVRSSRHEGQRAHALRQGGRRAVRASGARRQRPVPGSEPHRRGRPAPVGPRHRRQARPALRSRRRD